MGLVEITEPFFEYICTLKKLSKSSETIETVRIEQDFVKIFNEMQENAGTSAKLLEQYDKIKLPLIFFADYIMYESKLQLSEPWNALAMKYNELAGEEKFFVMLEEELDDKSEEATERLAIYYTCLGLGLKDAYLGEPEELYRLMSRMFLRVSEKYKLNTDSKVTPEAYEYTDKRDFTEQLGAKMGGVGILFAGLLIIWIVACFCLYNEASENINSYSETINGVKIENIDGDSR